MVSLSMTIGKRAGIARTLFSVLEKKFGDIAQAALAKDYELDVAFVGPVEMKKYNLMYRNKDKPTDILSFPLSKRAGQIFICPSEARREAKKFDRTYQRFLPFLFIHGCVHLKGHDHGAKMERIEAKLRRRFNA